MVHRLDWWRRHGRWRVRVKCVNTKNITFTKENCRQTNDISFNIFLINQKKTLRDFKSVWKELPDKQRQKSSRSSVKALVTWSRGGGQQHGFGLSICVGLLRGRAVSSTWGSYKRLKAESFNLFWTKIHSFLDKNPVAHQKEKLHSLYSFTVPLHF